MPEELKTLLDEGRNLLKIQKAKAEERVAIEGLDPSFAMKKLAFYQCFKCKIPYYGGLRDCAAAIREQEEEEKVPEFKPEDYVCSLCQSFGEGAGKTHCEKHGDRGIMYKCRYCCEVAIWHCFGTTHFCEPCHSHLNY